MCDGSHNIDTCDFDQIVDIYLFLSSVKRANGPVGQSRGNSTAGHPQPNSIPKIQNGGHIQRQQTGGNPTAGSSQPNVNVKSQNGGNT